MNAKAKAWFSELRSQFLLITVFPVCLGAMIACTRAGKFSLLHFLLTLAGAVFFHLGTNVINDYFDYLNGTDNVNDEYLPGFSGGARLIQNKALTPEEVLAGALILFCLSFCTGVYLTVKTGIFVLLFGVAGLLAAVSYSYFKNSFYAGEVIVGLCFGVLVTMGSYYVQTGHLSFYVAALSLPSAILTFLILWINEFPDYKADLKSGKKTLVVRIGRRAASKIYILSAISLYLCIIFLSIYYKTPLLLLSLITAPLAYKSMRLINDNYDAPQALSKPAGMTVLLYAAVSSIILIGLFK